MKTANIKEFDPKSRKKTVEAKAEQLQQEAKVKVRRSFTITQDNMDKIQVQAIKLTEETGKIISGSEALRHIIDNYKVKK